MAGLRLIRRNPARPPSRLHRVRVAPVRACRRGWARGLARVAARAASPIAQIVYAAALALFGAWLIAVWVIGLLLIIFAVIIGLDALLREGKPAAKPETRHEEILQRWREAR